MIESLLSRAHPVAAAFILGGFLLGGTAEAGSSPSGDPDARERGANTVRIDADDAYLAEGDASFWFVSSLKTEIPFALSSPAPPEGIAVNIVSSLYPPLGSVTFGSGETSASVVRMFQSEPFVQITPQVEARFGYVGFNAPPPGVEPVDPTLMWVTEVRETGLRDDEPWCALCFAVSVLCYAYYRTPTACDQACYPQSAAVLSTRDPSAETTGAPLHGDSAGVQPRGDLDFSWTTVMRAYRDNVLATTPEGTFYVDFYMEHSADMIRAFLASPSLVARVYRARVGWVAGLTALVDGQGDTFVVTQAMEDDLLSLLDTFEAVGSPALSQALAFERARLQLDQIAGLTMTQYQNQIETLGGVSGVETMSWGRMKALYR